MDIELYYPDGSTELAEVAESPDNGDIVITDKGRFLVVEVVRDYRDGEKAEIHLAQE